MKDWAELEVEIATKDCNDEYTKGCYESALKAYKSLCSDGHSGCSFSITSNILKRLLDNKPLSPINETDFPDEPYFTDKNGVKNFQCYRKGGLFKKEYPDGTIKYNDIDRYYGYDIENTKIGYNSKLIEDIVDEMFPIKMPYNANKTYAVATDRFLLDEQNGGWDHRAVLFIKDEEGNKYDVNKFFKEENDKFVEISEEEYYEGKLNRID